MTIVTLEGTPGQIKKQARDLLGLDCPICPIRKATEKQITGSNIIDKLAAHIERGSFDYITADQLRTFINYCESANGTMQFPTVNVNGKISRTMNFTPSEGSVSSEFVK